MRLRYVPTLTVCTILAAPVALQAQESSAVAVPRAQEASDVATLVFNFRVLVGSEFELRELEALLFAGISVKVLADFDPKAALVLTLAVIEIGGSLLGDYRSGPVPGEPGQTIAGSVFRSSGGSGPLLKPTLGQIVSRCVTLVLTSDALQTLAPDFVVKVGLAYVIGSALTQIEDKDLYLLPCS